MGVLLTRALPFQISVTWSLKDCQQGVSPTSPPSVRPGEKTGGTAPRKLGEVTWMLEEWPMTILVVPTSSYIGYYMYSQIYSRNASQICPPGKSFC